MKRTRFPELAYSQIERNLWRFFVLDAPNDPSAVGPHYRTRAELLADLERYAAFYGFGEPQPCVAHGPIIGDLAAEYEAFRATYPPEPLSCEFCPAAGGGCCVCSPSAFTPLTAADAVAVVVPLSFE